MESGYKSEDSEAVNSIASRTRSHSQRKNIDQNRGATTSVEKRYRSESDTSEFRHTDTEGEEYTPHKQAGQKRKKDTNTSKRSVAKKSSANQSHTTEQYSTFGERRRKLRSSNSRTSSATTSTISSAQQSTSTSSSSVIPKKRFRQSDPEALNLGARLAKSGSGREPQQRNSIQELHSGQPPSLLRRSSRSKGTSSTATTGSCVSTSASTSQTHSRHIGTAPIGKKGSSSKGGLTSTSIAFDATSATEPSTSQAAMANDGSRSNDSLNTNPTVKLNKPLQTPTTSSPLDVSNVHLISQQTSSSGAGSSNMSSNNSAGPPNPDSESDDTEVGHLQALLETKGLPPNLFSALGPRMHHMLHRTIGVNSSSKAQQLLQGLQSQDESQQLQAAIEMCQMLVMGNEDTLAGFPIKLVVPALITLLRMEHNFDIMNNACRALAYMLEALPRSSNTVVDAIPVFLEKLQVIQCMDVAEQSLTALEILSRRHSKAILHANGVTACLTYLDFFSINAQRAALAITANCCLSLQPEEFHFVSESLPSMARLLTQQDKKCVESVCTAFYRLIESFQHEPNKLQDIAKNDLLKNCQELLVVTPSVLNSGTFTNVVRMLSVMCANCPDLAITLLKNDIASTLLYLLTGSAEASQTGDVELVSRSPSELYEITCLIGELMPRLPSDGIFSVDALLERPNAGVQDQVQWQWRDDRAMWHSYSAIDSRMIEAAHMNSDDELSLSTLGRTYTVDFNSMQQINEDTGTTRKVQRKVNPTSSNSVENMMNSQGSTETNNGNEPGTKTLNLALRPPNPYRDARIACLKEERGLAAEFIKNLFSVLYEVYSSSAGPSVRYKCLRALLRMVYFANPDLLREVLRNQILSSHIAGMMASNDLRIVVGALQMADILMQKLPEVFGIHFRRDGVMHQINLLADPAIPICANPSPKCKDIISQASPPASTSNAHQQLFDFEAATSSNCKSSSHIRNLNVAMNSLNSNMSISMPSTSSMLHAASMPSTSSSSAMAISLNRATTSSGIIDFKHQHHPQPLSLPTTTSSHHFQMYSMSAESSSSGKQFHQSSLAQKFPIGLMNEASGNSSGVSSSALSKRSDSPGPSKVTDILKRKVPPKRKSQTNRSKTRQEEQSSVVQDLINRATNLGTCGRSTPSSSSSSSRCRFSGTSKTSSFLASLNPARWGRQGSQSLARDSNSSSNPLSKSSSNSNLIAAGNREKARQWIRDQAIQFVTKFGEPDVDGNGGQSASTVLSRLSGIIQKLDGNMDDCVTALRELRDILIESDISPFEVNHSGLIKSMLHFMANEHGIVPRDDRLRAFLHIFAGLPLDPSYSGPVPILRSSSFSAFVAKLNGCVTQLEQFPVKVHDFPAGSGGRSNQSALRFFNTHQLKCNLQRHPDCTNLRQWRGGTVKIDPLAMVQAIERYLVARGYGGIRVDSEDDTEEEIEDTVATVVMSQTGFKHKLQFLIGDFVLPYNMTVYQAVKQFSSAVNDQSETEADNETPIGNPSVWAQQHTIYYRPLEEEPPSVSNKSTCSTSSSRKNGKSSSSKLIRKKTEFWTEGSIPPIVSPLTQFLSTTLPADVVTVQDASLDALCMLRIVNALNRHWESLYGCVRHENIISQSEFVHSKIAAKANRQLQDPLVIMTSNIPQWLPEIVTVCPFLFPFETRHLLFYVNVFDRDRALQRLLDTLPDLNSADTTERVTPRLDRRKKAISRDDILKQAESLIQDFGHSKALLEIQYENEVGTGLGPTLEFYALVSAEIQRCDLGLWNGSDSYKQNSSSIVDVVKTSLGNIDDEPGAPQRMSVGSIISNSSALNMLIEQSDNMIVTENETIDEQQQQNDNLINSNSLNESVPQTQRNRSTVTYVNAQFGLFPAPIGRAAKMPQITRLKTKFKFLGKLMAKAVMDSRMLDLPCSIPFYRWILNEEHSLGLTDLARVAPEVQATLTRLYDIVKQRDAIQQDTSLDVVEKTDQIESLDLDGCLIADLGLDFVLPGHANIELRRNGRDIAVNIHNLHQYISLVTHWFLVEGVQKQYESFREGFDSVFPSSRLRFFYPEELENVFCGSGSVNYNRWDVKMLQESCRIDHGFTQESKQIQQLYEIMSNYNRDEQRSFLQFVTGSPCLPNGGFKSLSPPFTIVRKTLDSNQDPDDYLPSVMTCANYLKLPEYSNRETMRLKLKVAANEGSMSFHLS
ncbi:E3 ubiquitin-protein ligase TRIP12 [Pseudolycoriella hygida]|uniref:E3 ubiquitin-protein ligase n=1 Tax=Pseudolycoriella hygida TaxID=35572 RepID=A0A9Q0RXL6_9DIPT|nr:E3 ubiquitin-protein ligase TRIP12 [Pseudolycoriella hygida]